MEKPIYSIIALVLFCNAGLAQTPQTAPPASNLPPVLPAATPLGRGPFKAIMEAAKMFQGDRCSLCVDTNWVTRKKRID